MTSQNRKTQKTIWKYAFGIITLILGAVLSYLKSGPDFLGFPSVGSWLLYIGIISLAVAALQQIRGKRRIVDERMQFVATKAARLTFIAIILAAFIIMVIDGIRPIAMAYSQFMSYLVCGICLFYFVSYKLLLRRY